MIFKEAKREMKKNRLKVNFDHLVFITGYS